MDNKLLHTPEGFRDIYGEELRMKLELTLKLLDMLHEYGYKDIATPSVEFFDVFSSRIGTTPSKELYKFFDKEGNTLVLRPDFTPSIARCAAKYYMEAEEPLRFCYYGNTFINSSDLQGRLKESTQIGAELINDGSFQADAEIILMMIEVLKRSGLSEFQITVGNVEYFKGLCDEFSITGDAELSLREMISNKNFFGASEIMDELSIPSSSKKLILRISDLFGSIEKISLAKSEVSNERSLTALERLESIYGIIEKKGLQDYITFDLSVLSKYHYYTGIIVDAYTYGTGDAVIKGGRYDHLLSEFGKKAPAVGFAVMADRLITVLRRYLFEG
ncbi:MAG: ATP phosphoribosyltransferase regulatory subunit [Lachnospiraceae bacterium]|nr:ATP phosphoribosyltransferase regulatory subunit [Lachnospiraceae bacterium]